MIRLYRLCNRGAVAAAGLFLNILASAGPWGVTSGRPRNFYMPAM